VLTFAHFLIHSTRGNFHSAAKKLDRDYTIFDYTIFAHCDGYVLGGGRALFKT
jgi:hypothetical protein